jgi:hypothetical protein
MGPRHVQVDNLDRTPRGPQHADSAPWQQQRRWYPEWRSLAVLCAFALLLLLIGYWLFGRDVRMWIQYGGGDWVVVWPIRIGIFALLVAVVRRAVLVNQRGYQVPIWKATAIVPQLIPVDKAYADRLFPVAAQVTNTTVPPALMDHDDVIDAEVVPEVVPPSLALVPDQEWLGWIDRTPHLMIAGRTEAGKTTMAEAVIAQRAMAGEMLYVLDPHYQPGKWCGLPATGGGRGYDDVMNGLGLVLDEMDIRYQDFNRGKRTEDYERLTVFIDEVPALVEWCFDGKRLRDQRWMSFAKQLGSEARKVRISVILMTQSPLVQDIQINTRMRENFTRIALGDQSIELIKEAREPRRSELERLIADKQFTATMEYRNQIHALDTTNVPNLARRYVAHLARPWQPQASRTTVSAAAVAASAVSTSMPAPGAIVYPAAVTSKNAKVAWLLKQKYSYRFIEDELNVSHATIRQVKKALGI